MEIIEVDYKEYSSIITEPYHVFGSGSFTHLNQSKADKVYYLLFKDSKYRLGLTGGIRDNIFLSPFSAPFGGFQYVNSEIKLNQIEEALNEFIAWARGKKIESIRITLPPNLYQESFIAKQSNVLYRKGFFIEQIELNFSFNTEKLDDEYSTLLWRNARKNLKIGTSNNLIFFKCSSENDKNEAYSIIKKNREAKGYPLRMTWEQMKDTIEVIKADFFICKEPDGKNIAAAITFYVAKDTIQVIYWGDDLDYSHLKTMNYLSYNLFKYYKEQNIRIIDIGPSTENSIPNYGLCEFKESIGCDISQKLTFELKV